MNGIIRRHRRGHPCKIDFNHPLAGNCIRFEFEVRILAVEAATP
jgi:FKBP-type peptidyl-prolyl cis-trans isomerase 2